MKPWIRENVMRMPFFGFGKRDPSVWYDNGDGSISVTDDAKNVPEGADSSRFPEALAHRSGIQATIFDAPLAPRGTSAAKVTLLDGRMMRPTRLDDALDAEAMKSRDAMLSWGGVLVEHPSIETTVFAARRSRRASDLVRIAVETEIGLGYENHPSMDSLTADKNVLSFRFMSEFPPRHVAVLRSWDGIRTFAYGAPDQDKLQERTAAIIRKLGGDPEGDHEQELAKKKWSLTVCSGRLSPIMTRSTPEAETPEYA